MRCLLTVSVLTLLMAVDTASAADVRVTPDRVVFSDTFARRQLLVTADGRDATRRAGYVSRSPGVVEIDDRGYAVPKGNGVAEIEVRLADRTVTVPVEVRGLDQVRPVDFATEIEPLLSRFGCNSGGCHGKATGQNGFKLSLFGFDTEFDYAALVKEGRGRRVFAPSPGKSLLLTKASGRAPHGGGKRIEAGSEPYRLLQSWLQAGAPPSAPSSPRVVKLRLSPAEQILSPNDVQQLVVLAEYSDGSQRDVTREAQYSSNLDVVAVVADDGLVTANEPTGEAAIMARYMGQVAVCTILRPQGSPLAALPEFQPAGYVDELSAAKWMKLGLRPSPVCDDATYLRRFPAEVMLDAVDHACGVKSNFGNMSSDARAVDLPHENFGSYFLDAFDRPRRVTGCECERSTGATLSQVLLLANSDELENKLADGNGRIERLTKAGTSSPRIIEDLYIAAFARYPTAQEVIAAEGHLARDSNVRQGLEDVLWSLLNSREFGFNH